MGLQAKLILNIFLLLAMLLGASCWLFYTQSRQRLSDLTAEQACQIATALALGSADELRDGNVASLQNMSQDLLRNRNILFVAFLDAQARPVAVASRDSSFTLQEVDFVRRDHLNLMQVREKHSKVFGGYGEVVAPVMSFYSITTSRRLEGYVAVGISSAAETVQIRRTTYMVVGAGCVLIVLSMPLAYLLVRRIFQPVHELVGVTKRIIGGNLDARVATVMRRDVIGELARSFNEMVRWVRNQQQDVAAANQKLADANRDLEDKVQNRTAQLETAMKRLSSEIAEKEDFLRAVSHDLNAPLRNISGMATMLLMKYKDKFDEDMLHRLERIKKNVDVETDLIGELLELSRIKTRRQKMEPVELEAMIWEFRGLFENDLKSKAIDLIVETSLPVLEVERVRIRQVFQNLIDNAIKYMGDGTTRQIRIGCALRAAEAEFYVRDTGMGIDPEDIDKVFFVFRRGKNSAAQNITGKGVGLASVKSIVETYSGKIWVESNLGQGTTFRFTINGKHVPTLSGSSAAPAPPPEPAQEPARQATLRPQPAMN